MTCKALVLVAAAALAASLPAQNCAGTSVGITPLNDLAAGLYHGFPGGLYGTGQNVPPPAHAQLGLGRVAAVQPRDAAGAPAPGGRIVLLSIGMSNTTQEFSQFVQISNADPNRAGAVVVVDGAQGGQHAGIIVNPNAQFWSNVEQRLSQNGVTPQQVQAVWLKQAVPGPTGGFPAAAVSLQGLLAEITRVLKAKYPNLQLCFLSSRIYAGYATTGLNPEPYAYESGFAVQWTIAQQIAGDPTLNADPQAGPVTAPWLGWGPYLWADGLTPRSDGLIWECQDFQPDGTHPSGSGRLKVAQLLDQFFRTSPFATPWYVGPNQSAQFLLYGAGCGGAAGVPVVGANSLPWVGNASFRLQLGDAAPGRPAMLFLSGGSGNVPVVGSCAALIDPLRAFPSVAVTTSAQGRALFAMPVPAEPTLAGFEVYGQWFVEDPTGTPLPPLAGLAVSRGARMRVGLP